MLAALALLDSEKRFRAVPDPGALATTARAGNNCYLKSENLFGSILGSVFGRHVPIVCTAARGIPPSTFHKISRSKEMSR
jgi:hypothetical protein